MSLRYSFQTRQHRLVRGQNPDRVTFNDRLRMNAGTYVQPSLSQEVADHESPEEAMGYLCFRQDEGAPLPVQALREIGEMTVSQVVSA